MIDSRNFDEIVFPATRRVVAYEDNYQPVKEPVLVAIDIRDITVV
jgi:hypothetical protein